ncbi:hypothetical protein CTI12_AA224280 [Artemisia annua]|uniref:Uncharacterized protein n=1 Tax=Artemisia annua TaxID=35608 RepID=A0A2U1NWB5_ARTAN|nr:hypothetical protein CTI12_AA224280 [Artemisia annua]
MQKKDQRDQETTTKPKGSRQEPIFVLCNKDNKTEIKSLHLDVESMNSTRTVIHVEPVPHASSQDSGVGSSFKSKHDFIETLFGVSLKTLEDIDAFAKAVEAGNYTVWDTLDDDVVQRVQDAIDGLWKALKVSPSGRLVDEAIFMCTH